MVANSSFSLSVGGPGRPGVLIINGGPSHRGVCSTTLKLCGSHVIGLVGGGNRLGDSIVVSRLPAVCFHKLSGLVTATQDGGITILLNFRSCDRLAHSCKSGRDQIVRGAINGIFDNRMINRATGVLSRHFNGILRGQRDVAVGRQRGSASVDARVSDLVPTDGVSGLARNVFINTITSGFSRQVRRGVFRYRVIISGRGIGQRATHCIGLPRVVSFASGSNGSQVRRRVRTGCSHVHRRIQRVIRSRVAQVGGSPRLYRLVGRRR